MNQLIIDKAEFRKILHSVYILLYYVLYTPNSIIFYSYVFLYVCWLSLHLITLKTLPHMYTYICTLAHDPNQHNLCYFVVGIIPIL